MFVLIGYLIGPFLSMVDSSIVNVALVDMSRSLHAAVGTTQWVVSSYLLAMSAALPLTAWLSKRFTEVRVFTWSVAGFTVASAACGFSPNIASLVAARAVQGFFGAFLIPLAMTKLLGGGEKSDRTAMPAVFGLILFMAPAIAPSFGGFLLQAAGWPVIFFVNVPFGLLGFLILVGRPNEGRPLTKVPFDFLGLAFLSAGLFSLTYASSRAPQDGWLGAGCLPFLVAGIVAVLIYVLLARRNEHPAVSLASLTHLQIAASDLITMLTSITAFGMIVLSLIFLQQVRGVSPLAAGTAMIPQALLTGVGTWLSPKILARIGIRRTAVAGLLMLIGGTLLLLFVGPHTSILLVSLMLTGRAFAIGMVVQPLTMILNARLPDRERTEANTLFMICQRLGGALGISVIVTFFQERARVLTQSLGSDGSYEAFHQSVFVLAAVATSALLVSAIMLRSVDRKTEPSIAPAAGTSSE